MNNIKKDKTVLAAKMQNFGYLFAAMPPLIYWIYWTLNPSIWFNADPAAVYFLDSLSIFAGNSYKFVDHPGTPLELIGSFLLALTYPFFNNRDAFVNFHLSRPSVFFFMTNIFLLSINILCVIVFYKTVISTIKHDRMLGGIALALMYFSLHPYSFPSLTFWSQNSFNFPWGTLWLLWFYRELQKDEVISRKRLILLGIAAGMFATTQIYFVVWLIAGIFTIFLFHLRLAKNIKKAFVSGVDMFVGGLLGILATLIPIYSELPRFANWLISNITHQGPYGTGEQSIYKLTTFLAGMNYWWGSIRPMVIILFLTITVLGFLALKYLRSAENMPPSLFAMTYGLLFLTALILLVMSKAVLRLRFSLSLAAVLPLMILMAIKMSEILPRPQAMLKRLVYIATIFGVIYALTQQMGLQKKRALVEQDAPTAKAQAVTRLAQKMNLSERDIVVVYAFAVPLKCPSLLLASIWEGSFEKNISDMCPNQYAILDLNEGLDADFITARPIPNIRDINWDLTVWPGNGSNLPEYLYSIDAVNIPDSWHVRRPKWFFVHSDVANK